jgi:hypothetical protein
MIGMKTRIAMVSTFAVAAMVGYAAPASAQATRTWVSGVGDDVNPCSRTAPCKTFAGAISKTAAGGEINCLDPGGFGAVTITKSMTIDCHYTEGGALAGGNGITVNDSASGTPNTAVVFLRGLDIFGVNPPTHGIRFISGAALHVEDTVVRRFNAAGSFGISFQPAGVAELYVSNTVVADNGGVGTGGGILIQPTGASGVARVVLMNVRANRNTNNNLSVTTAGLSSFNGINVVVEGGSYSGSTNGINLVTPAATTSASMMVNGATVDNNSSTGLIANGGTAVMRVANSTVTANALGVSVVGGAQMISYGNNRVLGNPFAGAPNNGSFTGAPIAGQ